jgi:methyl-accepting chemotaxis protein
MKKWSLNSKVIFVIAIIAFGSVVISYTGTKSMSQINDDLKSIAKNDVKRIQLVASVIDNQRLSTIAIRDIILERNDAAMLKLEEGLNGYKEDLFKNLADYRVLASDKGKAFADEYKGLAEKWFEASKTTVSLAKQNKDEEVAAFRKTTTMPLIAQMRVIVNQIEELTATRLENAVISAQENYEQSRLMMMIISFISIASCLVLAFFILRAVTKAIDQVIASLTDSSNQVTSAAQQIASSSEELSSAATEQASSLEETASSIEEMNSMVQKNSENAKRTSEFSNSSQNKAEHGKVVVLDMIKAIDDISTSNTNIMNQIEHSNQRISEIVKVISEIGNKTKVINDIVFQTKLLSFNASVEAARAGENGKGFAVVAEEVGNLAEMSGNAAKEITAMLDESIQKVEGIVNETKQKVGHLIQDGKSKVEAGSSIARQCGAVLNDIVENVSHVTQMANEISTACQEQAIGVGEITKAMNQLDQVTQTNASTSEEAASAAIQLSSQAESLRSTVGVLVQEIKGGTGHAIGDGNFEVHAPVIQTKKSKAANVLPLKRTTAKSKPHHQNLKKVSGGGSIGSVPSGNDSRFEDA